MNSCDINVYSVATFSILEVWYSNSALTEPYYLTYNNSGSINYSWGNGAVVGPYTDWVSVRIFTTLTAPATATYTFQLSHDDGIKFYIDDVLVFSKWIGGNSVSTFTADLVAFQKYDITVEF